jgi:predicted DNA-binding transcriptional regulator AlpA
LSWAFCFVAHEKEQVMEDRLLRLKQVLQRVPVSKSTWWSWCASGKAPAPIKLGERVTVWKESSIMAFIEKQGV